MNATRSSFSLIDSFCLQHNAEELNGILQRQQAIVAQVWE